MTNCSRLVATKGRALIIGGGIGGLCAALALRQAGWDARVFEQAERLREAGAGLLLTPNGLKALAKLGVGDEVLAAGLPIESSELRDWRGHVLTGAPLGALSRRVGVPSIGIHRPDLLGILAQAVGDAPVRCAARCVGFDEDGSGVAARFADGTVEKGDLLVGADGLNSVVRAQLLGKATPRYSGYTCWRGVASVDAAVHPPGRSFEAWGPGRRFGALSLPGRRVYWFATRNSPAGEADAPSGRKAELRAEFRCWFAEVPALIEATDEDAILHHDLYDWPPVARWSSGRATLLGDAAHATTPNLGQGVSLAIEDAVVLGRCLAATPDVGTALEEYEASRIPRTSSITKWSRTYGQVAQWENPVARWLRDTAVRLTPAGVTNRQVIAIGRYEV